MHCWGDCRDWQPICLHPESPRGSPLGQLFTSMAGNSFHSPQLDVHLGPFTLCGLGTMEPLEHWPQRSTEGGREARSPPVQPLAKVAP